MQRAKAYEGKVYAGEYSTTLIDANSVTAKPSWVGGITDEWIDFLVMGLFETLGEAVGIAEAMDKFIMHGRDLLSPNTYFVSAPRCGAHFSWDAWNNGKRLSDAGATKFFYEPIERFAVEKDKLPDKLVETLGFNFHFCLVAYAIRELNFARMVSNDTTSIYNELNQRRGWDHDNRWNIQNRMRGILDGDQALIDVVTRILERADRFESDPDEPQRLTVQKDLIADVRGWQDEVIKLRATL